MGNYFYGKLLIFTIRGDASFFHRLASPDASLGEQRTGVAGAGAEKLLSGSAKNEYNYSGSGGYIKQTEPRSGLYHFF